MVVTVPDTPMMVWVLPAGTILNASSICASISATASAICPSVAGVFQMTLRHTDRPDIHGERGLHLRARMGDAVASQHQFGGTSAQIDHQIGGLDLAMDDAGGTKEA